MLTSWTSQQIEKLNSLDPDLIYYLSIYGAFMVAECFVDVFRSTWVFIGSLKASKAIFHELLDTVLYQPLRWFDTVPLGRILNRFSDDISSIDSSLADSFSGFFYSLFRLTGIAAVG
jgi:ABC-type multidrug transport system fused ATPase/permease subunit